MKQIEVFGIFLLGISTLDASASASVLQSYYSCERDESMVSSVFQGLRNTTQYRGQSGYYTRAFRFELRSQGGALYRYSLMGQQAFCRLGEQCAGPYLISEGDVVVEMIEGKVVDTRTNPNIEFQIDVQSGKCFSKVLDFRIKKRLQKFRGKLSSQ